MMDDGARSNRKSKKIRSSSTYVASICCDFDEFAADIFCRKRAVCNDEDKVGNSRSVLHQDWPL
jgi:hypothetical protein